MEAELVVQSRVGDTSAFEELVRRHFKEVFRFCRRYARNEPEAEDLAQESFVNCYRALRTVRGRNFKAWLFRIVLNVCRSHLRKRYREERKMNRLRFERGREEPAVEAAPDGERGEMRALLRRHVEELPDRQREVLTLHLSGGLSHAEIAATLGITYDDVKTNLSLARRRLTERLSRFLKE